MTDPTPAQQWARDRNLTKGRLMGMRTLLKQMLDGYHRRPTVLTWAEYKQVEAIRLNVGRILMDWDDRNDLSKFAYTGDIETK